MRKKKESRRTSRMIHLKVYIHKGGGLNQEVKGHVVLCDEHDRMTFGRAGNTPINHWDEIPRAIRAHIDKRLRLVRKWQGKCWEYEPRSRTTR